MPMSRYHYAVFSAATICAGLGLGSWTVAGMNPLPVFVPAKPYVRVPDYDTPATYPVDTSAEYAPPVMPVAYQPRADEQRYVGPQEAVIVRHEYYPEESDTEQAGDTEITPIEPPATTSY